MVRNRDTPHLSRRDLLRYAGIVSAATAITAGLGACGDGGESSEAADGKTIEATLAFTLSSGFDPMNSSSAVATAVNQHVFEALVDLDPITRQPYPALAAELPVMSLDGSTWTAKLRPGAKFSDGSPVTAADVAWSFQRALDPANKALMASFIEFIDTVTATDEQTVTFKLKAPFSLFPQRIAVIKIVPKAKTGDAPASKTFDTAPVGSGPFTVVSANATAGVVMGVNANYNGPRPAKVEKITLRTSPDSTARLNDLQGGASQAIEAVPYLDVKSVTGGRKVEEKQAFNHLFLMFNCTAAPFDDKRVRQALHYAIDKEKVIQTALQGYATPATSYLDEGNAGYQKAATVYGYDPDKAKSLLAAAGVSNLSFELVTTDAAFIKDSAPVLIDAWKAIGVTATLNTNPSSAVYGTIVPGAGFRVLAASGDPTVFGPDTDLLLRWFYVNKTWTQDRHRWSSPAAKQCVQIIEQAAKASGAQQTALWKQALDLVADEVPLYPVFHVKTVTAYDPAKIKDFQGAATTGLYFLGASRA
jgi:peptide/nickel transport system substrate-binding protein